MKTAIVVGGGIAGIVSAILLKKKIDTVYLIEKESHLGGLLKSYQNEAGLSFDSGSHFLRDTGIKELDQILYGDFSESLQVLGSLKGGGYHASQYNEKTSFLDARTLSKELYQQGMVQCLESCQQDVPYKNLDEQIRGTFGEIFAKRLFEPILRNKFFGCDLKELSVNSHLLFGLSRIIGFTPEATRELKKSSVLDSKLAFHSSAEGVSMAQNYYPSNGGAGRWIELLTSKLSQLGVRLILGDSIEKIRHSENKVQFVDLSNGERLECDHLVWTIPIFLCIQASELDLKIQASPIARLITSLYHFEFDQPFLTSVHWIQCHEPSFSTFRVTLYPNFQSQTTSGHHLTVEVISKDMPDTDALSQQVYNELVIMKTIPPTAKIIYQKYNIIQGGFPFPTHQFVSNAKIQLEFMKNNLKNATFLGKASGKTFLMNEVLVETFNTLKSLNFKD